MLVASLFETARSVMCLGAHPDDIEIGCGGTLAAMLELHPTLDVRWLVLTGTETRQKEARHSAATYLGDDSRLTLHGFRDGYLPYDDPARVKDAVVAARSERNPDIVLAPRLVDAHQDHRFVGELAWQVFRDTVILEYEIAKFEGDLAGANVYAPLSQDAADRKVVRLFASYPSQHDKPWFVRETFLGLMRLRGVEAGSGIEYAEAFTASKLLIA